jgi:5-formyltetrahydrofolate cyclo-ligase
MSIVQRRALDEAKPVLLPRIAATGSLEFAALGDPLALREGRMGILEPPCALPPQSLDPDDLVLVPGLAFDREGGRLGRGGGYYDRALAVGRGAELRPLLIGVGFSYQLVERVPMGELDVRLDGVVSELELFETGGSRQWLARNRCRIGRLDRDD